MNKKYLLGNEAIAYGLVEGNIDASFAYPGTPSSEITEKLIELSRIYNFYVNGLSTKRLLMRMLMGSHLQGEEQRL